MPALPTFEQSQLMKLIAVLSFGLTALFSVLELGVAVPATFVVGFFIMFPLVWVLGDDFPFVRPEDGDAERGPVDDPIATLRERYATGAIDEAEFERRLDRLLETEDLEGELDEDPAARRKREPAFE